MEITLDLVQSMGMAAIVYLLGRYIKSKVSFFQKYFIPAPVIGGLIYSVLIFIGQQTGLYNIVLTTSLQDFCMNLFFTATGFTCSIAIIKQSGKQGAILAVGAVLFLFVQNLVGAGLAGVMGINKLLGVAMGSIAMSGGIGSAASFGPTMEGFGADAATTIGIAAATFGLLAGSLVGGPTAEYLIKKYDLKSDGVEGETIAEIQHKLNEKHMFISVLTLLVTTAFGSILHMIVTKLTGLSIPYYVGCLFAGMIVRNVADSRNTSFNMTEINTIGDICLNLFLSLALMNLNISKLLVLALPMLVILVAQTIVMILWARFVTFTTMGKDYDAAVMAAGHCGVGLGQTPNAVANMAAIIEKNGPAPKAWFILPVITVVFINITNPLIITFFINLLK